MALLLAFLALLVASPAAADRPGDFDYWLLALSWSPSWCALEGDARGADACEDGAGHGFTLHGLWPQYETGWPEWCDTTPEEAPGPVAEAMAEVMGSSGLARHQWRRHGTCSGLGPAEYFALSRTLFGGLDLGVEPGQVRAGALAAEIRRLNPGVPQDGIVVTCRDGLVQEVRLCLDRAGGFASCGRDVLARACRSGGALALPAPR